MSVVGRPLWVVCLLWAYHCHGMQPDHETDESTPVAEVVTLTPTPVVTPVDPVLTPDPIIFEPDSDVNSPCYFWPGARYADGKCFKLFAPEGGLTWDDAQASCQSSPFSQRLVEVNNVQQMSLVLALTQLAQTTAWMGITDRNKEGDFRLATSGSQITIQGLWGPEQPDDRDANQNCLAVTSEGYIQDDPCLTSHAYICEQGVSNPCQELLPGAEFHSGCCYLHMATPLPWREAQMECSRRDAFLAEPLSFEQIAKVTHLGQKYAGDEWLGGYADSSLQEFTWYRSGVGVATLTGNWVEPNDWMAWDGVSSAGLTMLADANSGWVFRDFSTSQSFICQADVGNPCEEHYPGSVYTKGLCLKLYQESLTWPLAQNKCQQESATLVEFLDAHIVQASALLLASQAPNSDVFIGLTENEDGNFTWAKSGQPFELPELWEDGQPLNVTSNQDYAVIGQGVRLKVVGPKAVNPFICMKEFVGPETRKYVVAPPHPDISSSESVSVLQLTTAITSHPVYVTVKVRSGLASSRLATSRFYVTSSSSKALLLDDDVFVDRTGIYPHHVEVMTSHPVTVVLYHFREKVSASLLVPQVRPSALPDPESYFLFSPSDGLAGNWITVASMYAKETHVVVRIPQAVTSIVHFHVGGVKMKISGDVRADVPPHESFFFHTATSLDGFFLWTSHPVLLVIASLIKKHSINDYVMTSALPTTLTSHEYVTFPILNVTGVDYPVRDEYTVVAIYDNTVIEVEADLPSGEAIDIELEREGDVKKIDLELSSFYLLTANKPFYLAKKSFMLEGQLERQCLTTIVPGPLWRDRYHFQVPQPVDIAVYVYVIVESTHTHHVTLDGSLINATCTDIEDTSLQGCYHVIMPNSTSWMDPVHHLGTTPESDVIKFGAYVIMFSSQGLLCHPLGVHEDSPNLSPALLKETVYMSPPPTAADDMTSSSGPPVLQTTDPPPTPQAASEMTSPATRVLTEEDSSSASEFSTNDLTLSQLIASTTIATTNTDTNPSISTAVDDDDDDDDDATTANATAHAAPTTPTALPNPIDPRLIMHRLQQYLEVDFRTTSAFKRTKTSAPDRRSSSAAIGAIGVLVMCITLGFFIVSDVISGLRKVMEVVDRWHAGRSYAGNTSR